MERPDGFGPILLRIRQKRRWTQERLGLAIGVSQGYVSMIESGRGRPGLDVVAALAKLAPEEQEALCAAAISHRREQ